VLDWAERRKGRKREERRGGPRSVEGEEIQAEVGSSEAFDAVADEELALLRPVVDEVVEEEERRHDRLRGATAEEQTEGEGRRRRERGRRRERERAKSWMRQTS
jgi:hypothetical protein